MTVFRIGQGTTAPPLEMRLTDDKGVPFDLTGAQSVRWTMRGLGGELVVDANLASGVSVLDTVVDGVKPDVRYAWAPADTEVPGRYQGRWIVVDAAGDSWAFPSGGYVDIDVTRALA